MKFPFFLLFSLLFLLSCGSDYPQLPNTPPDPVSEVPNEPTEESTVNNLITIKWHAVGRYRTKPYLLARSGF